MNHAQQIYKWCADALRPPPLMSVAEHAESTLYLSERTSAIAGYINLDYTPYLRKPMELFTDPSVVYIYLCSGTQIGKTVFIFSILNYLIDYKPCPMLLVYPSMDLAKSISKERIRPMFQDCPSMAKHVTGDPNDLQLLQYTLDRMTVNFAWNSIKSVSSHPKQVVLQDETKDYPPYVDKAVEDRTKSFPNRKIIKTSSPLHVDDQIWRPFGFKRDYAAEEKALAEQGAGSWMPVRRFVAKGSMCVWQWHVPCPHCEHYQLFHPDRVRWDTDIPIRDLPGNAWYECENCNGHIMDHHKAAIERRGEWRTDNPGGNAHGFHLSSLHTLLGDMNFGEIAAGYLRAKISGSSEEMQAFINSYLAWPYEEEEFGENVINIAEIAERDSGYHKNTIPDGCKILTCGVDVHAKNIYYSVWGWGDDGRGWLISWGIVETDMKSGGDEALEALMAIREVGYASADRKLRVIGFCVDSGYCTEEVYTWAKQHAWIMPVKGKRGDVLVPEGAEQYIMSSTRVEKTPRGKSAEGVMLRTVNTGLIKRELYDNIRCNRYDFPIDTEQMVLQQINSEKMVTRKKKTTGEIQRYFVKKTADDDDRRTAKNHYLDTCVYARACKELLCAGLSMDEAVAKYYKTSRPRRVQADYQDM